MKNPDLKSNEERAKLLDEYAMVALQAVLGAACHAGQKIDDAAAQHIATQAYRMAAWMFDARDALWVEASAKENRK